eukprot:4612581-Amphidinium_carterae.1
MATQDIELLGASEQPICGHYHAQALNALAAPSGAAAACHCWALIQYLALTRVNMAATACGAATDTGSCAEPDGNHDLLGHNSGSNRSNPQLLVLSLQCRAQPEFRPLGVHQVE